MVRSISPHVLLAAPKSGTDRVRHLLKVMAESRSTPTSYVVGVSTRRALTQGSDVDMQVLKAVSLGEERQVELQAAGDVDHGPRDSGQERAQHCRRLVR
jgi:hypothetical protein